MDDARIRLQLKTNLVALISLVVALTALGYTTWRNERTEYNRNVRVAAFETLKQLGEAQIIVEYAHFNKNRQLGDPLQGWGRMIYIRDLAKLLPAPAPDYPIAYGSPGGTISRRSRRTTMRWSGSPTRCSSCA